MTIYKMGEEIITFGDVEVEKHKFHQHNNPISMYDVSTDKAEVSNRAPYGKEGFKYSIGYKDVKNLGRYV